MNRLGRAVILFMIVASTIVLAAPIVGASKKLDAYKSNTKELKSECADGGGDYVGSKTGRLGTCMWPDGTETTCNNSRKGKNCTTYGRIVTEDSGFLDFVDVALTDSSSVTVVPGDGKAADGRKEIKGLLRKEDFEMTEPALEDTCTDADADLIARSADTRNVCFGSLATIFCDHEEDGDNCTIEKVKKGIRPFMKLLRRALVDPSSVTIVVSSGGSAPPPGGESSTTTTEPATTTTEPSTTSTTEPPPAFL